MLKWAVVKDVKQSASQPSATNSAVGSSTIKRTPVKKKRKRVECRVSTWRKASAAPLTLPENEENIPTRLTDHDTQRTVKVLESCCGAQESIPSSNQELKRKSSTREESNPSDVDETKENNFRPVQHPPLESLVDARIPFKNVGESQSVLQTKRIRIVSPPLYCEMTQSSPSLQSGSHQNVLKSQNHNLQASNQVKKPTPIKSILKSSNSCTLPRHQKQLKRNTLSLKEHAAIQGSTLATNSLPVRAVLSTKPSIPNHDLTDPGFLESSPKPLSNNRISIKRGELRKLKRLQTNTDKLSRFLKKYYRNYLPNLPEDEEASCSPEEKSIHTFINRGPGLNKPTPFSSTSAVPIKETKLEETEM